MSICVTFKKKLIDYVEKTLSREEERAFSQHLESCPICQVELQRYARLVHILDADEVTVPDESFFDNLKIKVTQRELMPRRIPVLRWFRVLVPVCAVVMLVFVIVSRRERNIAMSVPISVLLEDREIARISLTSVIDEKLVEELMIVEEYLISNVGEIIDELTDEERDQLIKSLYDKYGEDVDLKSSSGVKESVEDIAVSGNKKPFLDCIITGFTILSESEEVV